MLIGITDAAFIGRVGTVELAAAAFTHGIFGLLYIVGIGLLIPVGVYTARDHGAGDVVGCAAWLRHGKVVALVVGGGSFVLLAVVSAQLHHFGQPPEVVAVMRTFFLLNSLSLIPVFYFQVQRQSLDAHGRPWVGTSIMIADVALNALLNWIFIWGHCGAPALGLTGSGIATLIARTLAVSFIALWLRRDARVPGVLERGRFGTLLRMGDAGGGQPALRVGRVRGGDADDGLARRHGAGGAPDRAGELRLVYFHVPAGPVDGHGHPHQQGARGGAGVTRCARSWLRVARVDGRADAHDASSAAIFLRSAAAGWPRGFTPDPAVVALAAQLLAVAAVFQLFDGGQVVSAGMLRGLTDVKVPTVITFIAYWVLSLPIAYALAFHTALGPVGVWTGLAAGLSCAAVLLARRFHQLTRTR